MKGLPDGKRVDSFGHRVRWARQHNTKLSKIEFARETGIAVMRVTAIETGRDPSVSKDLLAAFARVLKTSSDWLKFGTERDRFFAVKDKTATTPTEVDVHDKEGTMTDSTTLDDTKTYTIESVFGKPNAKAAPAPAIVATPVHKPAILAAKPPKPAPPIDTFAGRVYAAREAAGMTLSMLANASDLTIQHLQRIEDGEEHSTPSPLLLARALKIDVMTLLDVCLAGRVRQRRVSLGISPDELAIGAGVRRRAIEAVESGQSQNPVYLSKLADALECDEAWLRTGNKPITAPTEAVVTPVEDTVALTPPPEPMPVVEAPTPPAVEPATLAPVDPVKNIEAPTERRGYVRYQEGIQVTSEIGALVRAARQEKRWTVARLAAAVNRSMWYISNLERATGEVSRTVDIPLIAAKLGVPLNSLLYEADAAPVVESPPAPAVEQHPAEELAPVPGAPDYVPWSVQSAELRRRWLACEPLQDIAIALRRNIAAVVLQLKRLDLLDAPYAPAVTKIVSTAIPIVPAPAPAVASHIVVPASEFDLRVTDSEFHLLYRTKDHLISPRGEFTNQVDVQNFAAVSLPPRLAKAQYLILGDAIAAYEADMGAIVMPERQAAGTAD